MAGMLPVAGYALVDRQFVRDHYVVRWRSLPGRLLDGGGGTAPLAWGPWCSPFSGAPRAMLGRSLLGTGRSVFSVQ